MQEGATVGRFCLLRKAVLQILVAIPIWFGWATAYAQQRADQQNVAAETNAQSVVVSGSGASKASSDERAARTGDLDAIALKEATILLRAADSPKSSTKQQGVIGDIAELLRSIAWPLAALAALFVLVRNEQIGIVLRKLSQRATHINVAGLEIKLNAGAQATIEGVERLVRQVPETHQEWISHSHISSEFHRVVSGLRDYLCSHTPDFDIALTREEFDQFRFTIHVPDVVVGHALRQLVNYLGADRGGSGRIFSIRRGIVGLAWRLEESTSEDRRYTEDELVEKWGMTRLEAKDTKSTDKAELIACVVKNQQGMPLAVLYADAKQSSLFKTTRIAPLTKQQAFARIDAKVQELCKQSGLTSSLLELERARIKVGQLEVFQA